MIKVTPTQPGSLVDHLAERLLLAVSAFAAGVWFALMFAGGPEADRADQQVAELATELQHARNSIAWAETLAAKYAQAYDRCAVQQATLITAAKAAQ